MDSTAVVLLPGQHQTLVPIPLLSHHGQFQPLRVIPAVPEDHHQRGDGSQEVVGANPEGRQIAEVISLGTGLAIGESEIIGTNCGLQNILF